MNYKDHALREFKAAGWKDEHGDWVDEMQGAVCEHVLKLLDVFNEEGHSGTSAPYAIKLFSTLADFGQITPLTGEDWEWKEVPDGDGGIMYQNLRCSHVFKDADGAYDIEGRVFYDWYIDAGGEPYRSYYTNRESRVPVEFPYTPHTEYVESMPLIEKSKVTTRGYVEEIESLRQQLAEAKFDLIWAIQVIMEEYPNGDERFRMAKEIMRKIDPSFRHWSE